LLPCYLYLIYYAIYGHKVRRWKISKNYTAEQSVSFS